MSKRVLLILAFVASVILPSRAALTAGTEYFIWLNIYEKLLGSNEAGDGPALSAFGTKTDASSYIFVAEASGKSGYVLLKQKSSGKYLAASSSNNWSMTLEARSTDDRFCWSATAGTYAYLLNKKNSSNSKYMGVDGANKGSTYVSVYYDKPKGSHSQLTIIPATGGTYDAARQAYVSSTYTNAQSVREIDYVQLASKTINRSDAIDIHLTANEDPITGSTTVNLGSDKTWLIFDNIIPSKVKSDYLKYVTIKGVQAEDGTNCRVAIYLNGAAVIPTPQTIFSASGTKSFTLPVGSHTDLGENNNSMMSFTLRRGYMATLATGTNGSGHSRVYVADHADLTITLPEALAKRVSSVYVKPWQYVSKKGWGNTAGTSGGDGVRATWYWSWNAGYWSTSNMEYVPCRQHRWWPGVDEVNSHASTATMSINEPEHSEQHTSDKCSCGGTTDAWTAYGFNAGFQPSGARIGSPQPTDLSYLTTYFKYVDENNNQSRCDFAITHAYWDLGGRDANSYATWFCDTQCKGIWNNTKRPVWLTEMEVSASWNSNKISSYEDNRKFLQALLQKIDECPWIERYAIYSFDMWQTYMYYEANTSKGLTPAGQVYRDHRATFAYNKNYTKDPVWWKPSTQKPSLQTSLDIKSGNLTCVITNSNTDWTDKMYIESSADGTTWETVMEVDRSLFDNNPLVLRGVDAPGSTLNTKFRVRLTTLASETSTSDDVQPGQGLLLNGSINATSKTNIFGWTCTNKAYSDYTKNDSGDTYLEVWDSNANYIYFDYYQDVTGLKDGVYRLSAKVFNSSNGVSGATVNDAVVLYAISSQMMWFEPVKKDSEIDAADELVIGDIVVNDGKLRVGIRNIKPMTARWAGGDDFTLTYLGTTSEVLNKSHYAAVKAAKQNFVAKLTSESSGKYDMSFFIKNPDAKYSTDYWAVSNVDVTNGESYDGQNTDPKNTYFDYWKGSSYTSSLKQSITNLPAGKYILSAILRSSASMTMKLTASTNTATVDKSYAGNGATGGLSGKGWEKIELDALTVEPGQTLNISLECNGNNAWWSADHFQLVYVDEEEPVTLDYITTQAKIMLGLSNGTAIDADGNGKITLSDLTTLIERYIKGF